MKRILCGLGMALLIQCGTAFGADGSYLGVKGGIFLPNGKGLSADKKDTGLSGLNTGYTVDVAVGFRPAQYAAIELGTGFFTASGDVIEAGSSVSTTAYGIPVTLTAKGVLDFERYELFAGAGAGYYFCFVNNKVNFNGARPGVDESAHGGALGYQVVAGGDYKVNERVSIGAEFKWFSTRPEIEITDATGQKIKPKWEFGGTTLNLGMKYRF